MIELKLINSGTGLSDAFAPDWQKLDFTALFSAEGTVQMDYAKTGLNYGRLMTANCEGALYLDGAEMDGSRFITSEFQRDDIAPDDVATIQAITWASRLKEIIVYPPNWPTQNPKENSFGAATVGQIMRTLLLAGQARGVAAANATTWTFTNSVDSNGNAWSQVATVSFNPGTTLWDVLASLHNLGMCDFTTKGRALFITNPGALGADKTVISNPVVLRSGRDIADSPVNLSVRELATTVLVEGDDSLFQEVNDTSAVSAWGRREGYFQQQNIPDAGTLTVAGQAWVDIRDHVREERTHELTFDPSGPLPFASNGYKAADYIFTDVTGVTQKYLVLQVRLTWDNKGKVSGGVTLNDRFDELDVRNQRRLDGFAGIVVAKNPVTDNDTTVPSAPTGLLLSSVWFTTTEGVGASQISAAWTAVATNTDGSAITDLDHYEVQWNKTTWVTAGPIYHTTATSITWSPVEPGRVYDVRVRAVDTSGHESAWTSVSTITAASDNTPPGVPSTPVVTDYLGTIKIVWDGLDNLGGAMPVDFMWTEVHISTVTGFTPTNATMVDQMTSKGASVVSDLTYGTPYYVKLISVDRTGNKSAASVQGVATPQQVVKTDIGGNVIGLDNIQFQDATNAIPDGSFEMATRRAELPNRVFGAAAWSFVNTGAYHGTWCLNAAGATGSGTNRGVYLTPTDTLSEVEVAAIPNKPVYARFAYRGTVGATGTCQMVIRVRTTTTDTFLVISGVTADNTWRLIDAQVSFPSNALTYSVYLQIPTTVTTGTWSFDQCEIRDVVESIIIKDAAITTAKIANLAVNDAQIGSVAAGKITVGSLIADVTIGARIKTANTGARVELNTAGLQAFNSGGTQTVDIAAATGNVTIQGQLQSGSSGRRMVVNPTGVGYPTIQFWPTGLNPTTISVGSGSTGNYLAIETDYNGALNSRAISTWEPTFMAFRIVASLDPNDNGGGHIDMAQTSMYYGWRELSYQDQYFYHAAQNTRFFGKWSFQGSQYDGLQINFFTFGAASGWSYNYAATLWYAPRVFMQAYQSSSITFDWVIYNETFSGFQVSYSISVASSKFSVLMLTG